MTVVFGEVTLKLGLIFSLLETLITAKLKWLAQFPVIYPEVFDVALLVLALPLHGQGIRGQHDGGIFGRHRQLSAQFARQISFHSQCRRHRQMFD